MFAKINGEKNEIPGVFVDSYPTIYFYAKGDGKKPIHYKGKNTLKGIKAFLKKEMEKEWREN